MIANRFQFQKYITGKRVAFVGPAQTLIGIGHGELIDSYDIVVRTGGSFPVKPKYYIDYGKKCNVLYINMLFARKTTLPIHTYSQNGLDYLIMKNDQKGIVSRYKNSPLKIRNSFAEWHEARKKLGFSPLMGNFIIYDILKANPAELYLTGMDCYQNGTNYVESYLPENTDPEVLEKTRIKNHQMNLQNNYLVSVYKSGKITTDDKLKIIIESL
jgi:hypothetical protein